MSFCPFVSIVSHLFFSSFVLFILHCPLLSSSVLSPSFFSPCSCSVIFWLLLGLSCLLIRQLLSSPEFIRSFDMSPSVLSCPFPSFLLYSSAFFLLHRCILADEERRYKSSTFDSEHSTCTFFMCLNGSPIEAFVFKGREWSIWSPCLGLP